MEERKLNENQETGDETHESILKKFAAGDKPAFSEIMKKYRNKALNFAYRYLGDMDEAEDAAQDCFVKVYFNHKKYESSRPFEPWFYSILANCCRDRIRRQNRFSAFAERFKTEASLEKPPSANISRDFSEVFARALQKLPPDKREIIVLRFTQDLSYQEIAEALGINQGTVMSRLFRAKKDLEKILKAMGVFE